MADYGSNATSVMIETINTYFKEGRVLKPLLKKHSINTFHAQQVCYLT